MNGLVKPEYGPGLPAIARGLSRGRLLVAAAVLALVVTAVVAALSVREDVRTQSAVVPGPPLAFNLIWREGQLRRVAAQPGELLRLETPAGDRAPGSAVVRPLRLPPYRGEVGGALPIFATGLVEEMARRLPAFQPRAEGRTRINDLPGYQILFQTEVNGRKAYGKRVILLPDEPGAREGAEVELLSTFSAATPTPGAVGTNGALKTPLRSFRFGTERP